LQLALLHLYEGQLLEATTAPDRAVPQDVVRFKSAALGRVCIHGTLLLLDRANGQAGDQLANSMATAFQLQNDLGEFVAWLAYPEALAPDLHTGRVSYPIYVARSLNWPLVCSAGRPQLAPGERANRWRARAVCDAVRQLVLSSIALASELSRDIIPVNPVSDSWRRLLTQSWPRRYFRDAYRRALLPVSRSP
jgi:hypothetical protein